MMYPIKKDVNFFLQGFSVVKCLFSFCNKYFFKKWIYLFFAMLHGLQDLISLTRNLTLLLQWKCRVLTTELLGNYL